MIGTIQDRPILRAQLHVPRVGVWHADVELDGEEEIEGDVELVFEGITWSGTVRRGGVHHGRVQLLIVGGAGGLERDLEPKYYADAPSSIVVEDLMRESGETLSATTSQTALSVLLARWTRRRERCGVSLSDLAAVLGLDWRVLADGTVWLGVEAWTAARLEHDVIEEDHARDYRVLGVDAPTLTPGTTLDDRRVSYVLHTIEPAAVRTEVWLEPTDVLEVDRPKRWLTRFIESLLRRVDRTALYPARVVSQAADGTLEVQIDDQRWPTLTKVQIRTFVPGATVKVANGARVLIGWDTGDARKPYAALWESGTLTDLTIAVQNIIKAGENASNFVALANLVKERVDTLQNAVDTHTHAAGALTSPAGAVTGTSGPLLVAVGPLGDVAATKLKAE
jgi:hypothetical protein